MSPLTTQAVPASASQPLTRTTKSRWRFSLFTLFIVVTVAAIVSYGISLLFYKRPFTPKIGITTWFHESAKAQMRTYFLYRARGRMETFVDYPPYGTLDIYRDEQNWKMHEFHRKKPSAGPQMYVITPVHERNFEKICRFVDRQSESGSSDLLFLERQKEGRPQHFDFSPQDLSLED